LAKEKRKSADERERDQRAPTDSGFIEMGVTPFQSVYQAGARNHDFAKVGV